MKNIVLSHARDMLKMGVKCLRSGNSQMADFYMYMYNAAMQHYRHTPNESYDLQRLLDAYQQRDMEDDENGKT